MIVDETSIDVAQLLSEIDDLKIQLKNAHMVINRMHQTIQGGGITGLG